ncbi:MAG TPA: YcnI family protein, partial [Candidatus Saccharimonadales bacterium]|nr:YcnI family protein [Candidatus Saccharimonadales bacterium]
LLAITHTASAHVVVKPSEVVTGSFETFSVSVPVERGVPTTAIKLDIPAGLQYVTPTVKPGWTISVSKDGEAEDAAVKSITWTGGQIEPGFRDDFSFGAKTPDTQTQLQWKAYQTYADGLIIEWNVREDQLPKKADGSPDFSQSGPFSITKVLDKTTLGTKIDHVHDNAHAAQAAARRATYFGIAGIVVGFVGVFMATRKKVRTPRK